MTVWLLLAALALTLWLVAAVDLARRRDAQPMFRLAWAVLLLVLPVAGPVIYLAGGRRGLCRK